MRSRAGVGLLAVALLGGASVARAQGSAAADPARRLVSSLASEIRGAVSERGVAIGTLVVPPITGSNEALAASTQRVRSMLLLELAKLPSVRIVAQPGSSPAPGSATVRVTLDSTREAVVLAALLTQDDSDGTRATPLLAAVPASPEALASLGRSTLEVPRIRVGFVPAGDVDGAVLAAAAGKVRSAASDDLIAVTADATRLLALSGTSFAAAAAIKHPRQDSTIPTSRDPRAGAIAMGEPGRGEIWVRPPFGGGYLWKLDGDTTAGVRGDPDVPLGAWPGGGVLVARVVPGTNLLYGFALSTGLGDDGKPLAGIDAPALEALVGEGAVLTEGADGMVRFGRRPTSDRPVTLGPRGSALALVPTASGEGVWILGDREDGKALAVTRVTRGEVVEAWQGDAPFKLCRLATGDWDGDGRREAVAIGCGERAALAVVRLEEEQ